MTRSVSRAPPRGRGAAGVVASVGEDQKYDVRDCDHDLLGWGFAVWSTGHAEGGGGAAEEAFWASSWRDFSIHASRVLWSTGQAPAEELSAMINVREKVGISREVVRKSQWNYKVMVLSIRGFAMAERMS